MSRSCHPADAFGKDRVSLVRHRGRALLAGLEFLLGLAHLGPLPVPYLKRHLFQRRGHDRERAKIFGITVALNDLR
jgi:hypothetical protein